ncbi:hypothetical protein PH586_13920 [Pseudomonas sp. SA3-5]|uniref:Uncharacterized protein n=1 Tax=Pseudomonas aestuarii TaxID=3018340 RepID=A0ABT4XH15_9PSED|nr:hypothetical protein [Pseudomonas aestuarii]MDA7087485.1 hypothetical protein [Pseudomonas aestuarii]
MTASTTPHPDVPQQAVSSSLQAVEDGRTERVIASTQLPVIGQWFWVHEQWFGCVIGVGSNFVELSGPAGGKSSHNARIHFADISHALRHEPDHQRVLANKVEQSKAAIASLMQEVQTLTTSLGVAPRQQLEHSTPSSASGLATLAAQGDIEAYKKALITAQKEALPKLRDQLRSANETLMSWISAEMLPLEALAAQSTDVVDDIQDRVFNIELYAGLAESVVQFCEGQAAEASEKLRVFQRMLFCDEEALLAYDCGGLEISDLPSFQDWLSQPQNRDRLLPYPRCLVAMRVRRTGKDRDADGSLLSLMHNLALAEADHSTFLFIRNGEQLYRISTAIEFDELIFPDKAVFDPCEPMMVKMWGSRVEQKITRREFESRLASHDAWQARVEAWEEQHPCSEWEARNPGKNYYQANPHRLRNDGDNGFNPANWKPFDHSNVYYDEALKEIADDVRKYNRVAVIVQGLFDRSKCLAPHPPIRSWTAEGFRSAIELIYDAAGLSHGEPPCFETYRARCNALIGESSILFGQQLAWLKREAQRECRRIDKDPRSNNGTPRPKLFEPQGDPGPGYLARPSMVQVKARKAVFAWLRESRSQRAASSSPIRVTLSVPFDEMFNVSAYQPGDYRMFFQDHRTRKQYLKWAPLLMAAEDYHQGRLKANEPA